MSYLSLVSQLSVNCVLFSCNCMMLCNTGLLHMCHSYSHDIIPLPISGQKLFLFPWEFPCFHGNSHASMGIPMHTSNVRAVGTSVAQHAAHCYQHAIGSASWCV